MPRAPSPRARRPAGGRCRWPRAAAETSARAARRARWRACRAGLPRAARSALRRRGAPPPRRRSSPSLQLGGEVAHHLVEGAELGVVRLGDLDLQALVQRDEEIEPVHRVQIHLLAQELARDEVAVLDLGGDALELRDDRPAHLVLVHSVSGCCRSFATSARNSAPRCPSLTRWSAARLATTVGAALSAPSTAHGRSATRPNPTSATCGG